jgi:arginine/lysine/ornithine decarboxylase
MSRNDTDQKKAPVVEALRAYLQKDSSSFGVPGHRSGKGAPSDIRELLGEMAFKGDASLQKGIDDRRLSGRVQQTAEQIAARAWGADHCKFSTNGSTLGVQVAMLTTAGPGDTILVARNAHKSVVAALIIGRLRPVFLQPDEDETWDIEHGVPAAVVEQALDRHRDAKAVVLTSPTIYGIVSDIGRIAKICHRQDAVLIVDEAWGAAFPFHDGLPPAATQSGADVAIASIHKTMAGLEQASVMLLKSGLVAAERFQLCYDLFETTSPSVPVMATIDASRRQFVKQGRQLLTRTLARARHAREAIGEIQGARVMDADILDGDARFAMDECKVLFDVSAWGATGWAVEDWMLQNHNVSVLNSDYRSMLAAITVGNDDADIEKLVGGLGAYARSSRRKKTARPKDLPRRVDLRSELVMTPADAFFAKVKHVPLAEAAGHVAAEMVSPYPPGIPRVLPGERISDEHVAFFRAGMRAGMFALDPSDMSLKRLRVVA